MSVPNPFTETPAATRSSSVATERGSTAARSVAGTPAPAAATRAIDLTASSRAASVARQGSVAVDVKPNIDVKPTAAQLQPGDGDRAASRAPTAQPGRQPSRAPSNTSGRGAFLPYARNRRSASVSSRQQGLAARRPASALPPAAAPGYPPSEYGGDDGASVASGSIMGTDVMSAADYNDRRQFDNQRQVAQAIIPASRVRTALDPALNAMGPPAAPVNRQMTAELERLREENAVLRQDLKELRANPLPRFTREELEAPNVVTDDELMAAQGAVYGLINNEPDLDEATKRIIIGGVAYAQYLHCRAWQAVAPIVIKPPEVKPERMRQRLDVRVDSHRGRPEPQAAIPSRRINNQYRTDHHQADPRGESPEPREEPQARPSMSTRQPQPQPRQQSHTQAQKREREPVVVATRATRPDDDINEDQREMAYTYTIDEDTDGDSDDIEIQEELDEETRERCNKRQRC